MIKFLPTTESQVKPAPFQGHQSWRNLHWPGKPLARAIAAPTHWHLVCRSLESLERLGDSHINQRR